MDDFYNPIDFSKIIDCLREFPEAVVENLLDFRNYGDANAHIRAFGRCISEWCDPRVHEDVLMKLFVVTLDIEKPYYWFHDLPDKRFKTIRDLLHAFLERFRHDRSEDYNELVDDFMETWKSKNLLSFQTTSSDIKIDVP